MDFPIDTQLRTVKRPAAFGYRFVSGKFCGIFFGFSCCTRSDRQHSRKAHSTFIAHIFDIVREEVSWTWQQEKQPVRSAPGGYRSRSAADFIRVGTKLRTLKKPEVALSTHSIKVIRLQTNGVGDSVASGNLCLN